MAEKIAVMGWMYSGKGTLAEVLVRHGGFTLVNFGDAVKADCCIMMNEAIERVTGRPGTLTLEQMERDKHMFRGLYQWYSDTFHKEYLGDYHCWVNKTKPKLEAALHKDVIVADLRYTEEYDYLEEQGFTFIRVIRPEEDRRAQGIALYGEKWDEVSNNPGEHKLDNHYVDYELFAPNTETIMEFAGQLLAGTL